MTEENGKLLLEAARALFTRQGYYATTLDAVAAEAGLTKGAVYARYASKADLFFALLEERIDRRIAEMELLGDQNLIDALVKQQAARLSSERDWLLLVTEFRVAAARDPALNSRYAAAHERLLRAIAAVLTRAAAGEARSLTVPASELASLFSGLGAGSMLERVAGSDAPSDELVDRANRALFEAVSRPGHHVSARPSTRVSRRGASR